MCLICTQYELGKLTAEEALRNLGESKELKEHILEMQIWIASEELMKDIRND